MDFNNLPLQNKIYWQDAQTVIYCADNREILPALSDISAIVTDPPYELGFMGKSWDKTGIAYDLNVWQGCLNALLSGGHLLAFSGTRTYHRMACAIEDSGFEIRDMVEWMYGQGFPKSLDIGKRLSKMANSGNMEVYERRKEIPQYNLRLVREANIPQEIYTSAKQGKILQSGLSQQSLHRTMQGQESEESDAAGKESSVEGRIDIETSERELQRCQVCQMSSPILNDGSQRWLCYGAPFGYGSSSWSLTPQDRSCASYRPQSEQQQNRQPDVLSNESSSQEVRGYHGEFEGWGTALKPAHEPICLARKPLSERTVANNVLKYGTGGLNIDECRIGTEDKLIHGGVLRTNTGDERTGKALGIFQDGTPNTFKQNNLGRFPANLIHDGSEEVMALFPNVKAGVAKEPDGKQMERSIYGKTNTLGRECGYNDSGSAARFFYCAKASRSERDEGLEDVEPQQTDESRKRGNPGGDNPRNRGVNLVRNNHPTVKPLALMSYLIKLITPPNGIILDPFCGSGSTLVAARQLGYKSIGIELDEKSCEIAKKRCLAGKIEEIKESTQAIKEIARTEESDKITLQLVNPTKINKELGQQVKF